MRLMRKYVLSFLRQGLRSTALAVAVCVFVLNIIFNVTVSYDSDEIVTIHHSLGNGIIMLVIIAVAMAFLVLMREKVESKQEKQVFLVFTAFYCIAAAYLILNVDIALRADAGNVSTAAEKLRAGDLTIFQTGYLNMYPHQIGFVLYDYLLDYFSMNIAIQFIMNLLFVIGTNYLLYCISNLLFKDHLTNLLTILLSFCFLPQFFFILFAYSNIPSFFFLTVAFYHLLKYTTARRTGNIIYAILSAVAAVFLRKNTMIGVIAMIIYLLLDLFKEHTRRNVLFIILLILGTVYPSGIVYSYFLQKTPVQDAGIPTVIWVAMGTDIDNNVRGPGWYNRSSRLTYTEDANRDPELAHELGVRKLEENVQKMKSEPRRAVAFFGKKIVTQWCEPVYQSIWSGPLETNKQYTHTRLLQSLYNGRKAERLVAFCCRTYMIALWGLAILFLLKDCIRTTGWEVAFMFLIGGFLFHIIWEAKSQYIYQYLLGVVPFAAYSLSQRMKEVAAILRRTV